MNKVHIQVAAVGEGLENGFLRDFVEDHSSGAHFGLENLYQVPADAFSLAVLISCQDQFVGSLELVLDLGEYLLLGFVYDIFGLVAVADIDAEVVLRKRPDMAVAGHHGAVRTQKTSDCLGLGRRLDDNYFLISHLSSPCEKTGLPQGQR